MPAGHIYKDNDRITWAHETSHGLASVVRNKYQSNIRVNGFYILSDVGVVLAEPNISFKQAIMSVPRSLRGDVFGLYSSNGIQYWNDSPLYIMDEWVAYTNGSLTRYDLKITERAESVQYMLEFTNYIMTMAMVAQSQDPNLKTFMQWHTKRVLAVYKINRKLGNLGGATEVLFKTKTAQDAANLRSFAASFLGYEYWNES
jgi:hypothetical protein